MSNRTLCITEQIYAYMLGNSLRETDLLQRLRRETAKDEMARMQIAPEQGQFMGLLVKILKARRAIEIGVYTGYSSLCTALALPNDGELLACDISKEWTDVAKRYWQEAGVAHKIDLHIGPAKDTLESHLAAGHRDLYDFAFIDADKTNYAHYYELCLELIRPGGLIVIDNVLWGGAVADHKIQDDDTKAIRAFNQQIHGDKRVDISLVPIADGLTLAHKLG